MLDNLQDLNNSGWLVVFVDREAELDIMSSLYHRDSAVLFILYGRRRTGKTTLLKKFIEDKTSSIYFLADTQVEQENIKRFRVMASAGLGDRSIDDLSPSWEGLFRYIASFAKRQERKTVIIIDEFQYLVKSNLAIPSLFQRLWDEYLRKSRVMLILCGSLLGMMYKSTLSYQSPLYGRRSGELLMKPMSFYGFRDFFQTDSFEKLLEIYSFTGGVPRYIEEVNEKLSVEENIHNNILAKGSPFLNEPKFILSQEIDAPATYFSILSSIAHGEHKVGGIAKRLEIKVQGLNKYLETLRELDLVARYVPITEKNPHKSKKGLYRIKDNFFRFWFRFVFPNMSHIELGNYELVLENIRRNLGLFCSFVYEDVAPEIVQNYIRTGVISKSFTSFGKWWSKDAEIDLMAMDIHSRNILVGECKWTNQPVSYEEFKKLKSKTLLLQEALPVKNPQITYALFSKKGFSREMISKKSEDLLLFDQNKLL
ncbi:MAG: ATP-binding protein [Desulfobacterales bacterium]|nr:ATP-binding protein [Desulfobacterales bacterium]